MVLVSPRRAAFVDFECYSQWLDPSILGSTLPTIKANLVLVSRLYSKYDALQISFQS